jgi:CubicO group peptidase (beta-lactamase class C family)
MQLVERGVVALDKPVAEQLPHPLNTYPRYDKIAAALVQDPQWPRVTPRMLLSHTSGLPNLYFAEPDQQLHLHFKPGARYSYSTDGINLLGLLVEAKLGKPLDQLMQQALFQPLGMKRTGLIYHDDFAPDVADRFDKDGKFITHTHRDSERAGGSMSSSADDLARFLSALTTGKLLSARTRTQMLTPQVPIPYAHQFQLGAHQLDESSEPKSIGLAYGLGWGLLTRTKFGPAFFKEGHGDGAQTYMICFERSQSCMIIQTNSDNGELAFRPLLEHILGDTVTPWEWQCYTPTCIANERANP